jgi:CheY-like chemotaxis protein
MKTRSDLSILIVEDEKLLNRSFGASRAGRGYDVHAVFTGSAVIAQLHQAWFDAAKGAGKMAQTDTSPAPPGSGAIGGGTKKELINDHLSIVI